MNRLELMTFIDNILTTCLYIAGGILVIAYLFFKDKKKV